MTAESEPADGLIGRILAERYQILQRLGEGAMGAVYKAKHIKVGRPFAVKVLHPRLLRDAKVTLRFEREAELAGRLRHANVVGVVDVGEVDGTRYMVMDFAEGPDLAELLAEAPMPAERIIHLVRQMLEGLYHAHEAGLIHRDFKPENVIIERDTHGAEMPRIVDFGIAILRDAGDGTDGQGRLTTNGLVLGTPHYMAPEQAVADPIDHRIDLFALGIVIYEMLSGRLPFDGSGAEVARANLLLDPPPIAQRVPYLEVDPLLEAFARRLMAKKREARPATAKAARELLDLIARDRRAAAAVLGVPMSERAPAVTQPVVAAPADAIAPTERMRPTPHPEQSALPFAPTVLPGAAAAPPIAYGAPRGPDAERFQPTSIRTPLAWQTASIARRRTPWLVAAGVLGAAGIAAAVLIATSGDTTNAPPPPPSSQVAITPPAPEVKPAPPPVAVVPVATTEPSEPPPPPPTTTIESAPVAEDKPAEPPAETKHAPRPPPTRPATRRAVEPRPRELPAAPVEVKPEVKTQAKIDSRPDAELAKPAKPAPRAPATGVTPKAISSLYLAVSKQLAQLPPDDAEDLRLRWRRFNVQALMLAPQAERDQAAGELSEILDTAAARKAKPGH